MKAKVFKYKSDGNTVVAPYMALEPYAENVYISLAKKNKYGNVDEDSLHLVFNIGNVYFSCGQYMRRFLNIESRKEEAEAACRGWVAGILRDAENGAFVGLLSIRVFEALGRDVTPLLRARETYKKKQEQRRKEEKEKEAEKRRMMDEQYRRMLDEQKQKFLEGDWITGEVFLEIARRDGFEIHIRTKGVFNRRVNRLKKTGTISFYKPKGSRMPDFSGCHKAISAYLKFLETIPKT